MELLLAHWLQEQVAAVLDLQLLLSSVGVVHDLDLGVSHVDVHLVFVELELLRQMVLKRLLLRQQVTLDLLRLLLDGL